MRLRTPPPLLTYSLGGVSEGRGVAPFPPFSARGCSWCSGVGWDVASPFFIVFRGRACG